MVLVAKTKTVVMAGVKAGRREGRAWASLGGGGVAEGISKSLASVMYWPRIWALASWARMNRQSS